MFKKLLRISIYLVVFLLPLFWLNLSFESFEFNKTYLLVLLSSLSFIFWLGKMVFEDKKIKIRKNKIDLLALLFLVVSVIGYLFSVDKVSSLFGFYGRFWPNLIGIISLVVFYFTLVNNISSKRDAKKGLTINKISSIFLSSSFVVLIISYLSLFGVWQKLEFLPQIMKSGIFNTVGGTFEQLSIFLSFILTYLVMRKSFDGSGKKNILCSIFALLLLVFLVILDFWPTWIIVGLSLFVFVVTSLLTRIMKTEVNRLSIPILLFIISLIFLFANPFSSLVNNTVQFPREISLPYDTSWGVGIQGARDNVLFGVGESNFNYAFSKYKPKSFLNTPFWQIRFDRPSSHIAEIISTRGALGTLSYLALIIFFIISVFKKLFKKEENNREIYPLFFGFLSLVIAQLVFYQNITLAFSFWLFLALSVSALGDKKEKKFEFKDFPEVGLVVNITFWVILIAVCFTYFVLARNYIADTYYRKYLVSPNDITILEKAIKFNDNQSDYHTTLARGYLLKLSEEVSKPEPNNESVVSYVALSIMEGRKAIETAPRRITSHETLGVIYREVQGLAQGAVDWGVKALEGALLEEPNNPILMTELAKLYLSQEKMEEAKVMFERALLLKPEYTPAGIQLALIKESEELIDEAIVLFEDIVKNDPFSIDGHFHLGRLYFNNNRIEDAEAQFISVISIFPNHSNALYSLGTLNEKRGDLTEALLMYNKVLDLNPNNEIIESKIKELTITPGDQPETENEEL